MKRMNFLWLLGLLMFATISFTSCSDNEEENSPTDLIGLWEGVSEQGWEKENGVIFDEWDEHISDYRWEFMEDGSFYGYELGGDIYGSKWEIVDTGRWKSVGRNIYIDFGSEYEFKFIVKELTASRLIVEITEKKIYEGTTHEAYLSLTMKRLQ